MKRAEIQAAGPPHPLRAAGFTPDAGTWVATGEIVMWWSPEAMDWILAVKLDSGRELLTHLRWTDLRVVEQEA